MDLYLVTTAIAVWGALTGTIALALNYRRHRLDRPRLKISGGYEIVGLDPLAIHLIVEVANQGRRPAFLRTVSAQVREPTGSNRTSPFQARELIGANEVEAGASRRIAIEAKGLTGAICFADIKRVIVRDQTDRVWRSSGLESSYLTEIEGNNSNAPHLSTVPTTTRVRSICLDTHLVSCGCVLVAQCDSEAQRKFYDWLHRDQGSADEEMRAMEPQVAKFLKSNEPMLRPFG